MTLDQINEALKRVLSQWHEAHRADFVRRGYTNLLDSFDTQEQKHTHTGAKYIRLDVGGSGAWMLDIATGIIYGIKGYGTPDKKKIAGDLNDPSFDGVILFRDRFRHGRFDNRVSLTLESKTFDTGTVEGLEQAEAYKARLENKYDKVLTTPVGLNRVKIEGRN